MTNRQQLIADIRAWQLKQGAVGALPHHVLLHRAWAALVDAEKELAASPAAGQQAEPTDEQLIALNAGERFFSESPTKYPEAGHGTQYHAGAPGVVGFARAAIALAGQQSERPAPAGQAERDEDEQYTIERAADLLECYADFIRREVKADDIEQHPYLPEIEGTAEDLRALAASQAERPAVKGGDNHA